MAKKRIGRVKPLRPIRLAGAAALALLLGCAPQMKSLTRSGARAPSAAECGKCHVEIYREWKASPHARAYCQAQFAAETLDHHIASCQPCHAPETIWNGAAPVATRAARREEGVDCLACHLIQGRHHGPFIAGALTPHATQADPGLFRDPALCGKCHAEAYRTWQAAPAKDTSPKKTCQECHMPAVNRKLTQATNIFSRAIVALHEEHELRRHTFGHAGIAAADAVAFDVSKQAGQDGKTKLAIRVRNNLPHAIPAGEFGYQGAALSAELLGAGDAAGTSATITFYRDLKTQLMPGQVAELRLPVQNLQGSASSLRLRLVRLKPNASAETITSQTFSLGNQDHIGAAHDLP